MINTRSHAVISKCKSEDEGFVWGVGGLVMQLQMTLGVN